MNMNLEQFKAEVVVSLEPIIRSFKDNATAAGYSAAKIVKEYSIRMLAEVVKAVEEHALPGFNTSEDKKAVAMKAMETFFDQVVAPRLSFGTVTIVKQVYMWACSYAIDAFVSFVNKKFSGSFSFA